MKRINQCTSIEEQTFFFFSSWIHDGNTLSCMNISNNNNNNNNKYCEWRDGEKEETEQKHKKMEKAERENWLHEGML